MVKWWHKMVFPVKRVWFALTNRAKPQKRCAALLKLHDDIQTCEYEDVHIMWEMLSRAEPQVSMAKRFKLKIQKSFWKNQRSFWKNLIWSKPASASATDQKR